MEHYIGVDVGTGSARACIIDPTGEIKALASKDIRLWHPQPNHYEQSTSDIWAAIAHCVRAVLAESRVDPATVRGLGFDATCSLAVFTTDGDAPVAVTEGGFAVGKGGGGNEGDPVSSEGDDEPCRNVVLWLDHRAEAETAVVNATAHPLLKFVGGSMSVEMEIPKVLWLRNHMPAPLFGSCKFYDLADALTHLATGRETRSYCSAVCKQGYVPVGVDGSVRGWSEEFYRAVGLGELVDGEFERMGGVHGANGTFLSAGQLVGTLSDKAAAELGLPLGSGIAVGSGVIDAYAGWIGTVGAQVPELEDTNGNHHHRPPAGGDGDGDFISLASSRLAAVAGTSTCHLTLSRDAVFVDGVWGPYRDVVVPGLWMAEGGQSATGELLRFVVETHPAYKEAREMAAKTTAKAEAEAGVGDVYELLNARLESMAAARGAPNVPHLARHLSVYGDLWGNRSPLADARMRGAVVGLDSDASLDGLARTYLATVEAVALQTRQIVEHMNAARRRAGGTTQEITALFMSGSQGKNALLVRLFATVCGIPVVLPTYLGAAVVHGAAMLGAKAAGEAKARAGGGKGGGVADGEALWDIMTRMTRPGSVVLPGTDKAEKRLLDAKYKVFLAMCDAQREWRRVVDEAVEG